MRNRVYHRWGKRAFDLLLSIPTLLVLTPVIACAAFLVRFCMGAPAFYCQERPGRGGEPFKLLKLRTMSDDRDPRGNLLPDADRLTPLGEILRRFSVDELPELFNVIRGDMSLVGPRPLLSRYYPYYSEREQLRHAVRPGITGWAQVKGRNELSWDARLEHDVWYVENESLGLDIRILALTLFRTLTGQGVVVDARSIMLNLDEERSGNAQRAHGSRSDTGGS